MCIHRFTVLLLPAPADDGRHPQTGQASAPNPRPSRNDSVEECASAGTGHESFRKESEKLQTPRKWQVERRKREEGRRICARESGPAKAGTFRDGPPIRRPTRSDFPSSSLELPTSLEFGVSLLPDRCPRLPVHQSQMHRSGLAGTWAPPKWMARGTAACDIAPESYGGLIAHHRVGTGAGGLDAR